MTVCHPNNIKFKKKTYTHAEIISFEHICEFFWSFRITGFWDQPKSFEEYRFREEQFSIYS